MNIKNIRVTYSKYYFHTEYTKFTDQNVLSSKLSSRKCTKNQEISEKAVSKSYFSMLTKREDGFSHFHNQTKLASFLLQLSLHLQCSPAVNHVHGNLKLYPCTLSTILPLTDPTQSVIKVILLSI